MEPRRKGEGREDGRPIEGPFGAQEGELAHVSWRKAMRRCAALTCACRKPHPCWWSERIGYPGGMLAPILFVLGILASPFKAKSRLEAENAALRQQLIVLRRKVKSRPRLANTDRWFFVQLYRWFPSIPNVSPSSVRRRWCVGIGPAFVVIGSGNHGAEGDDRRFGQSCVR